jgi:pilus assembly protein CpaB
MKFPKLPSVRPTKTWIVFGVALGVGLLAALVARGYLSNRLAEIEARASGKTINVVVAKHELRKGERISSDTVSVRPIPIDFAHSQAIAPDNFERVEGQALAYPVKSGEMILWGLLENKRTATFSTRVTPGHRAITVPVDEINSISGMLEPGDAIDLMASIEQKGKNLTFALLQNVNVMATGQRSADDPKSGEKRLYSTVTLDTTPQEAQNIIRAREAGKLTALLRNPEDKSPLAKALGDAGTFFAGNSGGSGEIPVLVGGRSGQIPSEGLHLGQYVRQSPNDKPALALRDMAAPASTPPPSPTGAAAPVVTNLRPQQ